MSKKVEFYLIAYYDGDTHKCFDEDRYGFEFLEEAVKFYKMYNEDRTENSYVKLYAYIDNELVLLGGM